ncbi:unnamed protein product [Rotaria magnacalcarata]|uniref:RING-type E3 ubiquitin transferase n=3 Tax=Rotaria magnacalcarata TaxID=392030 RepID=A0A8S2TNT8_9BILA|nr:unnamed protein product [Rotaria magnacalcarata]CAF4297208.1 unnamed protein product [Rotaria magnacalcarata]
MSSHAGIKKLSSYFICFFFGLGVSCDVCMRKGFPGRRYKCLLCDNYDLCGSCYDAEAASKSHKNAHPMQCLLTDTAFELFYAGESIPRRTVVSLTCPHCGLSGFISRTLLLHCAEKHPSTEAKSTQTVMCPICVTSTVHSSRSRFPLLTDHLVTVHENGTGGDDDDIIDSFTVSKTRATENEEDDSDEDEDEDDDNESSFNELRNRVFAEEEQRLQEAALQRLEHASSLAAAIRNEYAASANRSTSSQRRPFIRQTALRGGRSTLRGHFNHFPYGGTPRTETGFTSATTNRSSTGASTGNSSQNATPVDPYAAFVFGQDPMLEFVSRLVNNQSTSSITTTTTTNNQFRFGPSVPIPVPSLTNTSNEFARFQQHMENNESINTLKSSLLNSRHKRSIQAQQQQTQQASSSSTPSTDLPYPTGFDYQLWQQNFSALQPTINTLNFSTGAATTNLTTGTNSSLSKNVQQLNREHNARSLLGKILRNDKDVNTDGNKNETRTNQLQNHMSFLQSILLSSITTNTNDESNKHKLIINKENL